MPEDIGFYRYFTLNDMVELWPKIIGAFRSFGLVFHRHSRTVKVWLVVFNEIN